MINDQDISIVIQGPIIGESSYYITKHSTKLVCQRIRDIFPESEIILSVAKGARVENIIYDKIVFTEDPGATWFDLDDLNFMNNCNRMKESTLAGIKAASRRYVLKLRSDLFILSKSFLKYFYKYPYFDENYKFVKNRIIAFCMFSVKAHQGPEFIVKRPYHISDWAYFGYKEDLLNLYDIPLTKEPEFSQWFLSRNRDYQEIFFRRLWKMPPEQYITHSFFSKFLPISFEHGADLSNNNEKLSERLIANNFLVLDQDQFSLISLKYLYLQILYEPLLSNTSLFFRTWLKDYHNYCKVPKDWIWLKQGLSIVYQSIIYKLKNRLLRLLDRKYHFYSRNIAKKLKNFAISYDKRP